ncbi:MAG: DUF3596 domain-containing protein, partial [Thalassotalea sp.]|nr:DUF3596 domain-containing protein [Thalassotalea sp.]
MVNIRIRPNGIIQFDISIFGKRFRETTGLKATPTNLKNAKKQAREMNAQIDLKTFEYRRFFPHSQKCDKFALLKREKHPHLVTPYFDVYSEDWLARHKHQWKDSYYQDNTRILEKHLLPVFGNKTVNDITLKDVQTFRSNLCDLTNEDGSRRLGNKRINIMLVPLISILHSAADEFEFDYPISRLKPLR